MAASDDKTHGSDRSQSIDWYSEGESRSVEVAGIRIEVRHVSRKGRKARIAIVAPAGAVFRGAEPSTPFSSNR